jgi:hypothetical protein
MSAHRFRDQFPARPPAVGATAAPKAAPTTPAAFVAVPAVPAAPPAFMAEVYRMAYAAALARVIARRRCFAPFSLN